MALTTQLFIIPAILGFCVHLNFFSVMEDFATKMREFSGFFWGNLTIIAFNLCSNETNYCRFSLFASIQPSIF